MSTFTQAAISYHGIPPDVVVRSDVHTGDDGVLYLTVQIPIKDEDMGPIVKRMGQMAEPQSGQRDTADATDTWAGTWYKMEEVNKAHHSYPWPRKGNMILVPDDYPEAIIPMRYVPDEDLNIRQWRDDYAALTQAERGKYKSFQRYKAHRQAEAQQFDQEEWKKTHTAYHAMLAQQSEGVGGRKVQHVDVAEEQEAVSELPAAVWVDDCDMEGGQRGLASDRDTARDFWLMQVALLTPEQKAKYCGEQKP